MNKKRLSEQVNFAIMESKSSLDGLFNYLFGLQDNCRTLFSVVSSSQVSTPGEKVIFDHYA
jgi:hypothetical protein